MKKLTRGSHYFHVTSSYVSRLLYFLTSVSLIFASFLLICKAFYDLYVFVIIHGEINKNLLDAISFAIIAIAVLDVGRYLLEEEVQREKQLHSPNEARRTLTRFMVVIAIAVALEGLVGVFEASGKNVQVVLYPLALIMGSVLVMVGLGIFLRLISRSQPQLTSEQLQPLDNDTL
jgi:hypothetical protein